MVPAGFCIRLVSSVVSLVCCLAAGKNHVVCPIVETRADGLATLEQVPDDVVQIKVCHPDQLSEMAPQAYTVSASPGKLTLQLTVMPRAGAANPRASTAPGRTGAEARHTA